MTDEEVRSFIQQSTGIFAKRMLLTPHEYTLRKNARDEATFERFVMHIRHHGYRQKFSKSWYTYFDVDGWQYWTLGYPLENNILINRARF
jgi:hypothetical protein